MALGSSHVSALSSRKTSSACSGPKKTLSVAWQKLSDKYKWEARSDPDGSFIESNSVIPFPEGPAR